MAKTVLQQVVRGGGDGNVTGFRLSPYANARLFATRPRSSIPQQVNAGRSISYSIGHCRFGSILVARTGKGICAVLLGGQEEDKTALQRELMSRFPKTQLRLAVDSGAQTEMDAVCQYLEDPTLTPSIALDLQGSPFQLSVWKALLQVPQGTTETYTQIAQRANLPHSSARAVANACGQNHIAFLVPCHRIVRTDGQMGGYRWGLQTKEKMLELEKCIVMTPGCV